LVKFPKATNSFGLSVRTEKLGSHYTDFHEISYLSTYRNLVKKIQFALKADKNKWHFNEDQYTFVITPRSVLLRMKNVSEKLCRENQNTLLCSATFSLSLSLSLFFFLGGGGRSYRS